MKKLSVVFICCSLLLLLIGCESAVSPPVSIAPPSSAAASDSTPEEDSPVTLPDTVDAYNIEGDLPGGWSGLEIYGFGYDESTGSVFILGRAMTFYFQDATYLGDETYIFRLGDDVITYMWDDRIEGSGKLDEFEGSAVLADYYRTIVDEMGFFPPLRATCVFDGDEIIELQDAYHWMHE